MLSQASPDAAAKCEGADFLCAATDNESAVNADRADPHDLLVSSSIWTSAVEGGLVTFRQLLRRERHKVPQLVHHKLVRFQTRTFVGQPPLFLLMATLAQISHGRGLSALTTRGIGATNVVIASARDLKDGIVHNSMVSSVRTVAFEEFAVEEKFARHGIEHGETRVVEMTAYATIGAARGERMTP